jgi:hypothetical protein
MKLTFVLLCCYQLSLHPRFVKVLLSVCSREACFSWFVSTAATVGFVSKRGGRHSLEKFNVQRGTIILTGLFISGELIVTDCIH